MKVTHNQVLMELNYGSSKAHLPPCCQQLMCLGVIHFMAEHRPGSLFCNISLV